MAPCLLYESPPMDVTRPLGFILRLRVVGGLWFPAHVQAFKEALAIGVFGLKVGCFRLLREVCNRGNRGNRGNQWLLGCFGCFGCLVALVARLPHILQATDSYRPL